jgi:hypothetical protein
MNFHFGYTLGKSEVEKYILGSGSVGADILKAILPFFIAYALRNRSFVQALAAALVWAICTTSSMTASIGFAALNRADTMGERTLAATQYSDTRSQLDKVQEKLGWVPQHRSAAEVEADINAILDTRIKRGRDAGKTIGEVTNNLTETNWYSAKYADKVLALRKELAIAENAEKLEAEKAQLLSKLDNASAKSVTTADPQVAILTQLTGLTDDKVRLGLIVLLSLLLEVGSGLGFFVVLGNGKVRKEAKAVVTVPTVVEAVAEVKPALVAMPEVKAIEQVVEPAPVVVETMTSANDNQPTRKAMVPLISSNELKDYYIDRIEMHDGTSITASALYEDYCSWAEARGREPMTLPAFGREFGEIGIQKAKIAGRIRYINIKLKAKEGLMEVPKSPARRLLAASA